VTAWASGCSWSEALEISGLPPGDLARTLSRVLDAVRQLGNLPYAPMRKRDLDVDNVDSPGLLMDTVSRGLHPQVRRLCRDAARLINRYPVKDPLPFEELDGDEVVDTLDEVLLLDDDDEAEEDESHQ
jgi:DSHCT (NUC185) domain